MPSEFSESVVNAILLQILKARQDRGISQEQLAELSGIDLGVISRAERLIRIPGLASILDLAKALDLDFADLIRVASEGSK